MLSAGSPNRFSLSSFCARTRAAGSAVYLSEREALHVPLDGGTPSFRTGKEAKRQRGRQSAAAVCSPAGRSGLAEGRMPRLRRRQ